MLKYLTTMLDFTYLCCWVYCFNFVMSGGGVLDVAGVLVTVVVSRGDDRRDIDGGGGGPSGGDSSTCRMPLLLVDDDVPVRLLVSNERF